MYAREMSVSVSQNSWNQPRDVEPGQVQGDEDDEDPDEPRGDLEDATQGRRLGCRRWLVDGDVGHQRASLTRRAAAVVKPRHGGAPLAPPCLSFG